MRFLSLYSGIGGFDIALERVGMECVGQVEIATFCRRELERLWPNVKRICDVKLVKGDEFGPIDLICGGVPCQPASSAGKRRGKADDRWLWPDTFRLVQAIKPTWCLFENVYGIINLKSGLVFDSLLAELEGIGYDVQSFLIPACAVDAPHKRDRIFILAHTKHNGLSGAEDTEGIGARTGASSRKNGAEQFEGPGCLPGRVTYMAGCDTEKDTDSDSGACSTLPQMGFLADGVSFGSLQWIAEPDIPRFTKREKEDVTKIQMLGNAVVPRLIEVFGHAIMETERRFQVIGGSGELSIFDSLTNVNGGVFNLF